MKVAFEIKLPAWNWRALPFLVALIILPALGFAVAPNSSHQAAHQNCGTDQNASTIDHQGNCAPSSSLGFFRIHHDAIEAFSAVASTFAAIVVAGFTGWLIVVGSRQHQVAMGALRLARDEFVATHRPMLRLRRIWPVGQSEFANKKVTDVRIIVANIGGTEAILKEITKNIIWERRKNNRLFFEANTETIPVANTTVLPGRQAIINISSELEITPLRYAPGGIVAARSEVMAIGVIEYEDQSGGRYAVGFSRVYDADRNRFRLLDRDDPEADREFEN